MEELLFVRGHGGNRCEVPDDLQNVCSALGTSSLHELLGFSSAECDIERSYLEPLLQVWLHQSSPSEALDLATIPLARDLINLPEEFSDLFYEACQSLCPETGKQRVKPALCLVCGSYVCMEMPCCTTVRTTLLIPSLQLCFF